MLHSNLIRLQCLECHCVAHNCPRPPSLKKVCVSHLPSGWCSNSGKELPRGASAIDSLCTPLSGFLFPDSIYFSNPCLAIPLMETPFLCPCLGCHSPGGLLFISPGSIFSRRKAFPNPPGVCSTTAEVSPSTLDLQFCSLPAMSDTFF